MYMQSESKTPFLF